MEPPDRGARAGMAREAHGFATQAIHAGQEPDPVTGAVVTPLYQTSVFSFEAVGKDRGYQYSRFGNPTRTALQVCLAALEGGERACCYASGMAAADAAARLLRPGDHLLLGVDIYGGMFALVEEVLRPLGIEATYADALDADAFAAAIRPNTRMAWVESPTNPLLRVVDIAAIARSVSAAGALLTVDNTFATPYLQSPLALGADIVMHSTTKYIGGHSDVVGGALVTRRADLGERLERIARVAGAIAGPFDCWLTLRGVKTLAARMREHQRNAQRVAEHLAAHPKVARVYYPGLPRHEGHALAARQMRGFGGMLSVELAGGGRAARAMLNAVRLFALTGSLGGVESIISYPWMMSHAPLPPAERLRRGVTEGLIRLSVGIEEAEDLIADLDGALEGA